jgi:hypothetical protein
MVSKAHSVEYLTRGVLFAYSAFWLYQLAAHAYNGLTDDAAGQVVGTAFVAAAHKSAENYRNVKYLAITAMDMAVPYHALALWVSLRGSYDFAVALAALLTLVTAVGLSWKSALLSIEGAAEQVQHLVRLDVLAGAALLGAFLLAPSPKRQYGASITERIWLHLHGYVGLFVVAAIFVKPAGMWIVSLNNSATTNVMYHVVLTHVFCEALLHLVVALYGSARDTLAFWVAALLRILLSAVTVFNNADHAPDVLGLSLLLLVEGSALSFFVLERVNARIRKQD